MIMSTAIYLRVSTNHQSTKSQEEELARWVEKQDDSVSYYRDACTGKKMDRPGFAQLQADWRAGRIETIVVWRLDRLGRTNSGLALLFEELVSRNIKLVSLRDGFDLTTPIGKVIAAVLASLAVYETEVRNERVVAGIAAAKAKGKTWGGSKPGPKKKNLAKVRLIKRMLDAGESKAEMARATGMSRMNVYRVLERYV